MIYYFRCDYCQQRMGVIPEYTKSEMIKMDCVYCGAPLPSPTVTSESSRKERHSEGFFTGSSGYYIPMVTVTGEYIPRFAGMYYGEPIYDNDPQYKEIIKDASFNSISTGI